MSGQARSEMDEALKQKLPQFFLGPASPQAPVSKIRAASFLT